MKQLLRSGLILLTVLVAGCANPMTSTPSPTAIPATPRVQMAEPTPEVAPADVLTDTVTPEGTTIPFNENNVSFAFDPTVASNIMAEVVPATPATPDLPYWGIFPEHRTFTLQGYESQNAYHSPTLYIYPVAEFETMNAEAGATIAALRTLLTEQPDTMEGLPVLPLMNAAQVMHAQVRYLSFENGAGVRFVTQYDQAAMPINNQELFYTFQGLTNDGQFYVAAILPVSSELVADTDDPTVVDSDIAPFPLDALQTSNDPGATLNAYLAEVTERLEQQDPATYTPNLTMLDRMMESLTIQ